MNEMKNEKLHDQIISIIDDMQDMTIATVREDNFPQATTVSYVNDGFTLYFATNQDSQKAKNIEKNNRVSITIDRHYKHWDDIESLSLGAIANLATDKKEIEKISDLMFKKFPEITQYAPSGLDEIAFFRIEPKVISLLDYSQGFGHTESVTV